MNYINKFPVVIVSIITVFLSGCIDDKQDIKTYMETVQAKTNRSIEPMPEVKPFKHITYSTKEKRSPFVLPKPEAIEQRIQQVSGCLSPDVSRRKQPLEKHSLRSLSMRGTLGDQSQLWVLLESSDSVLHRVSIGNYLGRNHGKITKVSETKVTIKELSPDGAGCWIERIAELEIVKSKPNS